MNTIVLMERITREDIAARRESFSVYDILRLERSRWIDTSTGNVRGTLFLDGQPWIGSSELLRNRCGADIEEIRRLRETTGVYRGHGVVIEIISRRTPGGDPTPPPTPTPQSHQPPARSPSGATRPMWQS